MSNSNLKRTFIQETAIRNGFADRIDVETADINAFDTKSKFDRVVSVEMMEHVRNHRPLLNRIHSWMSPEGKMLVHVFVIRSSLIRLIRKGQTIGWVAIFSQAG